VHWTGTVLIIVGVSLMFVGLAFRKTGVPRVSFLGVPIILVVYSMNPVLVLANYLPWIIFGAPSNSPLNLLILFLMIAGPLMMIWGVLERSSISKANTNTGTPFEVVSAPAK